MRDLEELIQLRLRERVLRRKESLLGLENVVKLKVSSVQELWGLRGRLQRWARNSGALQMRTRTWSFGKRTFLSAADLSLAAR